MSNGLGGGGGGSTNHHHHQPAWGDRHRRSARYGQLPTGMPSSAQVASVVKRDYARFCNPALQDLNADVRTWEEAWGLELGFAGRAPSQAEDYLVQFSARNIQTLVKNIVTTDVRELFQSVGQLAMPIEATLSGRVLGLGLYPQTMFVGHSDFPNCYVAFDGSQARVVALRDIQPGEALVCTATPNAIWSPLLVRDRTFPVRFSGLVCMCGICLHERQARLDREDLEQWCLRSLRAFYLVDLQPADWVNHLADVHATVYQYMPQAFPVALAAAAAAQQQTGSQSTALTLSGGGPATGMWSAPVAAVADAVTPAPVCTAWDVACAYCLAYLHQSALTRLSQSAATLLGARIRSALDKQTTPSSDVAQQQWLPFYHFTLINSCAMLILRGGGEQVVLGARRFLRSRPAAAVGGGGGEDASMVTDRFVRACLASTPIRTATVPTALVHIYRKLSHELDTSQVCITSVPLLPYRLRLTCACLQLVGAMLEKLPPAHLDQPSSISPPASSRNQPTENIARWTRVLDVAQSALRNRMNTLEPDHALLRALLDTERRGRTTLLATTAATNTTGRGATDTQQPQHKQMLYVMPAWSTASSSDERRSRVSGRGSGGGGTGYAR